MILNLIYPEQSDIKYKIDPFPDGQRQVKILFPWVMPSSYKETDVQIKSRLNNFQDLELIACAVASLRESGIKHILLYAPYFLGSRSDRKFEAGSNNYLKQVICPIINSLGFESVIVKDPHSDALEACINNFRKNDNQNLVEWALVNIIKEAQDEDADYILISPDAGATKKIHKLAEQLGYTGEIITCSKHRNQEGKLTRTIVPLTALGHEGRAAVIIDDICDGGATFINIAKEMVESGWKGSIYLIITHGIFSKGFEELNKYFDGIYCTNSYRDLGEEAGGKVKQLNIF